MIGLAWKVIRCVKTLGFEDFSQRCVKGTVKGIAAGEMTQVTLEVAAGDARAGHSRFVIPGQQQRPYDGAIDRGEEQLSQSQPIRFA